MARKRGNRVVNMACATRKTTRLKVTLMSAWVPYIVVRSQLVGAVLSRSFVFETNLTHESVHSLHNSLVNCLLAFEYERNILKHRVCGVYVECLQRGYATWTHRTTHHATDHAAHHAAHHATYHATRHAENECSKRPHIKSGKIGISAHKGIKVTGPGDL